MRSSVAGPYLPRLQSRAGLIEDTIADTALYLKGLWPHELSHVAFDVAGMPPPTQQGGVPRWQVASDRSRIVFYRVPIERLARLHRVDDWHRRLYVEGCVFRAVAELLGRDPWDIAPERYRHF